MLCFRKFPVEKNSIDSKGVSRFCIEKFLSYKAEEFLRGTLQCVTNFGYRKTLSFKGLSRFPVDFFCPRVPKKSVELPFCAVFQNTSGDEIGYG